MDKNLVRNDDHPGHMPLIRVAPFSQDIQHKIMDPARKGTNSRQDLAKSNVFLPFYALFREKPL